MARLHGLRHALLSVAAAVLLLSIAETDRSAANEPMPDATGQASIASDSSEPIPARLQETCYVTFTNDEITIALPLPPQWLSSTGSLSTECADPHTMVDLAQAPR
jgi:hypothetical protein